MGMEPVAASREDEEAKKMEAGGDTVGQKLDAGALFVLQSKGKLPRSAFLLAPSINIISLLCFTCMASVCSLPTLLLCNHLCVS